jgi:hypothetical protein
MKPAVHAIGTPAPVLNIAGIPRFDGMSKGGDHARKLIWMNGVAGGPTLQFLRRLAEIFQDLPVEEFDLTRRIECKHETRNAIDDGAEFEFVCTL